MDQINFHHLWHFYHVAKKGSIRKAAAELFVGAPTISEQIKSLEQQLGNPLFERHGRSLQLSYFGQHVLSYAEEIFTRSQDFLQSLDGEHNDFARPLRIGVANAVPKSVAYRLIEPTLSKTEQNFELSVFEDEVAHLLEKLASRDLDIIISDAPHAAHSRFEAHNHLLEEAALGLFGRGKYCQNLIGFKKKALAKALNNIPILLPTLGTQLADQLEYWLDKYNCHPPIVGRFENSSLLKLFAAKEHGVFAAPIIAQEHIKLQYRCSLLAELSPLSVSYYGISRERNHVHPGVIAIQEAATARQQEDE